MELLLDKEKNIKIAIDMVKKLNSKENIFVPILDGFHIEKEFPRGFVAKNDKGVIEKFIWEENKEADLKKKAESVLAQAMAFGKKNNINIDNIFFLGEFKNSFLGNAYIYDVLLADGKFVREISLCFLSDEGKVFNQVSFSNGPYSTTTYPLLKDIKTSDFKNDKITKSLYDLIILVMKNIKK